MSLVQVFGESGARGHDKTWPTFWAQFWVHRRKNLVFLHIYQICGGQKTGHVLRRPLAHVEPTTWPFCVPCVQAAAVWSWCNWLTAEATNAGKTLLLLNLDETPVPLTFTHAQGNVMRLDPARAWLRAPRQQSNRGEQRSYFTHVGLICNDPAVQPLLPQVIFVGAKLMTEATFATIQMELPGNVYVKKMKKGWNNAEQHCIIIQLLSLVLQPLRERYQPLLMFDAAPLHLSDQVMGELATASIWYLVIPARLTWLMQPLDTHAFARYKRYLKMLFQDRDRRDQAHNATLLMVRLVIHTIRAVLQGYHWGPAFASNGLTGNQDTVSMYIKGELEYERLPLYPPLCPTVEVLRFCWPRNRVVNEAVVWIPGPARNPAAASGALGPPPPAAPANDPSAPAAALAGPHLTAAHGASGVGASSSTAGAGAANLPPGSGVPPPGPAARTARKRLHQKTGSQ